MRLFPRKGARFQKLSIFLIFLLGALLIWLMFPREGKFRYEFQRGKPWKHQVLVAPFDVPIYKYDYVIQHERDSALKSFVPYYRFDTLVYSSVNSYLSEFFFTEWDKYVKKLNEKNSITVSLNELEKSSDRYLMNLQSVLSDLYSAGIVADALQLENFSNQKDAVNIIKAQVVQEVPKSSVFTQSAAYQRIKDQILSVAKNIEPMVPEGQRFADFLELSGLIKPNLFYDEETSEKIKATIISDLSETQGMIQAGEKIIALGELINDEKHQILMSLRREFETNPGVMKNFNLIFLGQGLVVFFAFLVLYLFLYHFRKEVLQSFSKTSFIMLVIIGMAFMSNLTIKAESISLFVVPLVILPIILKTFYDARIALFVHIITILLISFWAGNSFEFIFMNFIAGVIAIFTLRNLYRRGILFVAAVFTFFSYSLVYAGISIMQDGQMESINTINFAWFGGNALLVLTTYPLIYIFEKTFGFVSDSTLLELSDTNQPLLRKLAEVAPGTFHHSVQVANLAESAALQIGGNTLLIRTGALYHDIGKLNDPMYYIENLTSTFNPHEALEFEESANKIISHVQNGADIAKKHKLPKVIIDFILTHHGTTTVQYFYRSFLKEHVEDEYNKRKFSYPGPIPFSKETAIVMMADSIEAASRSLKVINKQTINELVDRIIQYQFDEQQFVNTDLTFRNVENIKEVFKSKLQNIYHARIEYPK
jgi:cyclic-di-AMP phosphodiesterase PgpH